MEKKYKILLIVGLAIVVLFSSVYVIFGVMLRQKQFNFILSCSDKNISVVKDFKMKRDLNCRISCGSKERGFALRSLDGEKPTMVTNSGDPAVMNKVSETDGYLILQKIYDSNRVENLVLDKQYGTFSFTSDYNQANSFPGMPVSESNFSGYRGFCE
jgi:hypothetical protein